MPRYSDSDSKVPTPREVARAMQHLPAWQEASHYVRTTGGLIPVALAETGGRKPVPCHVWYACGIMMPGATSPERMARLVAQGVAYEAEPLEAAMWEAIRARYVRRVPAVKRTSTRSRQVAA